MSADDTQKKDLQRGISQSSTFSAWSREKSQDESEEGKVLGTGFCRR